MWETTWDSFLLYLGSIPSTNLDEDENETGGKSKEPLKEVEPDDWMGIL